MKGCEHELYACKCQEDRGEENSGGKHPHFFCEVSVLEHLFEVPEHQCMRAAWRTKRWN